MVNAVQRAVLNACDRTWLPARTIWRLTPSTMDISPAQVSAQLRVLRKRGLVTYRYVVNETGYSGEWAITEQGEAERATA